MSDLQPFFKHRQKVEYLRSLFSQLSPPIGATFKGNSNTTRSKNYKKMISRLDLQSFDQILDIDLNGQTVTVESRVTMDQLVKETLKHNLIPKVVPEFKGITVGGAILGAAAESSSYKWGIFSDSAIQYEILQGDGSVIEISENKQPELFQAFAGSYGSLGLLLSTTIQLQPCNPYVNIHCRRFHLIDQALAFLFEIMNHKQADFLDGIAISDHEIYIIEACFTKSASYPIFDTSSCFSGWFFQKIRECSSLSMSTYEYLFRLDKGAFWMGSFLQYPSFLYHYLNGKSGSMQTPSPLKKLYPIKEPPFWKRVLLSPWVNSQVLWGLLHKRSCWLNQCFMIQDFMLPQVNATSFILELLKKHPLFPIWICPIKGSIKKELFNPHFLKDNQSDYFINFGLYGQTQYSVSQETQSIEEMTFKLNGRKVLYATSFFDENQFWNLYSKELYLKLRKETHSIGVFQEITTKVLHS